MTKVLILKKKVNKKNVVKAVEIDLPAEFSSGWTVIDMCDEINFINTPDDEVSNNNVQPQQDEQPVITKPLQLGDTFESPVSGTAKLVRLKSMIKIVYRRGKKSLNKTSPDSVCITDTMKQQFFRDIRAISGGSTETWSFEVGSAGYNRWTQIMDQEYVCQLDYVNKKHAQLSST